MFGSEAASGTGNVFLGILQILDTWLGPLLGGIPLLGGTLESLLGGLLGL